MAAVASMGAVINGHYLSRSHTATAGAIQFGKFIDTSTSGSVIGVGGAVYPDPVTGSFRLGRIYANAGAVAATRGHLPGLWAPLNQFVGSPGDTFSGTGALAGRSFLLLDAASTTNRARVALETSDTWD